MLYKNHSLHKQSWSVEVDLNKDMQNLFKDRMAKSGLKPSSDKNCIYEYFNWQKRLIKQIPRTIEKSKEFFCPDEYSRALKEFENKILEGKQLAPYMSTSILKADYNDLMLNDWNIFHFHLTRQFREDGFAKRSNFELFAYFTEETAYFIQIYSHHKKNLYSTQEIIKIVYENWPQLIEKNRIKGALSLEEEIDDKNYEKLRKAHVTTFTQIGREKIFALIGGGYMSNGFSTEALRQADYWKETMRIREHILIENIGVILQSIKLVNDIVYNNLVVHLIWFDSDGKITFAEETNSVIIQFDYKLGMIRVCKPSEVFGYEPIRVNRMRLAGYIRH